MNITIRPCLISDLETLQTIGYETYDDTFREMNLQETMDKYLKEAFNENKLSAEIKNPGSNFYFLYADDALAGYIKVNTAPAQSDINDPTSLELERIYVKKAYKGKGLGRYLINYALQLAIASGKQYVWLGVWEKNEAAIAFYKKMGFKEAGRHSFRMGDELQTDLVMKKVISKIC